MVKNLMILRRWCTQISLNSGSRRNGLKRFLSIVLRVLIPVKTGEPGVKANGYQS